MKIFSVVFTHSIFSYIYCIDNGEVKIKSTIDLHAHVRIQIFNHNEFNLIECILAVLNYSERVVRSLGLNLCVYGEE